MKKKVLITGGSGFIGRYLAKHCQDAGSEILAMDILEPESLPPGTHFERCDIRDGARISGLITGFRPEIIFHLAAQSSPTVSFDQPLETMDINIGGTVCLFEQLRASGVSPIVVVACSSAEYGFAAESELPLQEDHALQPLSPYGVSKVAQDMLSEQYFANYGLRAIRIRIFNTTGPGAMGDVCSDLTRRAVEIEMGLRSTMAVGNLSPRRAIGDVRDLVRGLRLAAEHCQAGEVYNLGVNTMLSASDLIAMIQAQTGLPFDIEVRPALKRKRDEAFILGSVEKLQQCCAWSPEIPIASTLQDMLDWWRAYIPANLEQVRAERQKLPA